MVQLVLGMATLPTPDDAADALAIAVCIANRMGQPAVDAADGPAVLDRAAIAPIERGESRLRAGRARGARPRASAPSAGAAS